MPHVAVTIAGRPQPRPSITEFGQDLPNPLANRQMVAWTDAYRLAMSAWLPAAILKFAGA